MTDNFSEAVSQSIDRQPTGPRYATFTSRFRAVLIDTALVIGGMVVVLIGGELADGVPGSGRVAWLLMFGLAFLYEPVLIWLRGATVGHARNHLCVVADNTGRRPGLGRSFARYVAKVVLGLPSFVTMALTQKHQAVHDVLTGTTVQLAANAPVGEQEFYFERFEDSTIVLPSRLRRTTIMIAYLLSLFVLYALVLSAIDPEGCGRDQSCVGTQRAVVNGAALAWLTISLAAVVASWKGLLPGARRAQHLPSVPPVV
jgi:uncharacterized RDD family membrane protein YckC